MRILYALNMYRPYINGVGISIERQASGLMARGHEVAIIAPSLTLSDHEESHEGIRVFRLKAVKAIFESWRIAVMPVRGVERVLAGFDPDVVVVSMPFLLSRSAWQVARESGKPLVGITGVMPEWFFYNIAVLKPLAGVLSASIWRHIADYYNRCDHVVGVSQTALGFLQAHDLERPSSVISNGVELDRFCWRERDEGLAVRLGVPKKPTVLYAGRLDAEKRMDVWIKAIPDVLREVDAHFVVGGDGTEKTTLIDLVDELGIADHVSFPGFLPTEDYSLLYSLADVFAISSPAELQSIVTLEAAASGVPIVAAEAGALPELVEDGQSGFLFPTGDSTAMAAAIVRLLRDPVLRARCGQRSRAIAEGHDIQATYLRYEQVYQEVIARRLAA